MGDPKVKGELDAGAVKRVLRASLGRFKHCYSLELQKNGAAGGELRMKFVVNSSGAVATASPLKRTVSSAMASCITNGYRALKFPSPAKGLAMVEVPMTFSVETKHK